MNISHTSALSAAALLLVSACSRPSEPVASEPVARVTVSLAERSNLPIEVTGYGTVEFDPSRQQVLATEIEARVTDILVQPGVRIDQGAALIRLSPSSASGLDLSRTRSDLAAAEAELARQTRLRADGLASDADVERAGVAVRDLTAQAQALSRNAGAIRDVRAPGGGVIDSILVSPGDVIPSGSPLLRISAPDAMQARINLEPEDATRLSRGDVVRLQGLDGGTHLADAQIATVDLRVDPQTRMTSIMVPVPPGKGFLPGEAVRATVIADTHQDTLLVSRKAIFADEAGDYVFVDLDGTAIQRRVSIGATNGDLTEILSGLSEGEAVVTEGGAILSDGMKLDSSSNAPQAGPRTGAPQ